MASKQKQATKNQTKNGQKFGQKKESQMQKKEWTKRDTLLRASRSRACASNILTASSQLTGGVVESRIEMKSASSNRTYIITLNRFGKDGNHQCSCPDWLYRRGAKGKCKHIMAALREAGVQG
jgi:hypothetical protein